jgi:hypothetical protein
MARRRRRATARRRTTVPVPSPPPPRIAKRLKLTPGTVRDHISHSITKLRARNRIDAILTAGENNWL